MSEPTKCRPPCQPDVNDLRRLRIELEELQAWLTRFGILWHSAKPVPGPALFVSCSGTASRVNIKQLDGGRDAQYLAVSRKEEKRVFDHLELADVVPPRETIGFLPQVAGTAIIYDLTDETLQGKCRPFVCDLAAVVARVYALVPVQIEAIALAVSGTKADRKVSVEFHDARGERLQALLPFHFRIEADGKEIKSGYYVTESDGCFGFPPKLLADLPSKCRLTVRSQLTGRETMIDL
jgi:hypothetical protein